MNKERLLELASDLREGRMPLWRRKRVNFDMRRVFEVPYLFNPGTGRTELNFCGTMCCIAGMAALKYEPVPLEEQGATGSGNMVNTARRVLSLEDEKWDEIVERLFFPAWLNAQNKDFDVEDRREAAEVIERLVETGKVSWGEEKDEYDDK